MKLKDIYNGFNEQITAKSHISTKPVISFEIFPPKEDFETKSEELIKNIESVKKFSPAYISVTYGAGGGSQANSLELAAKIKRQLGIIPMLHFTCIGFSRQSVLEYLKKIENAEINHILALRGDIPQDMPNPVFDFKYANELVAFIREHSNLSIGVAGYPEGHKDCVSFDDDIDNLKRKVDAGAEIVITQLFYNNDHFFRFMEKTSTADINIPIIPGILPILSLNQIEKITKLCGASIDESLRRHLEKYADDPKSLREVGLEYTQQQCQQLADARVEGLHLYSLNKFEPMAEILENLL